MFMRRNSASFGENVKEKKIPWSYTLNRFQYKKKAISVKTQFIIVYYISDLHPQSGQHYGMILSRYPLRENVPL